MNMFQLANVSKEHFLGSVKLKSLQKVDLSIQQGKITTIIGPEASGKSRILHLLSLNDIPTSGNIIYKGTDLATCDEKELSRIRTYDVGLVPQSFHLNSTISVLDNVSMISKIMGEDNWIAREKAEHWLSRLGLQEHLNDYPIELGLFEFKKVGIAKAMIKKPEFLILDELYTCLSEEQSDSLFKFIYDLNKEYQLTIIHASRRVDYCKYSDMVYQMKNGRCTQFKPSEATAA